MSEINKAPRGTNDILPEERYKWQTVEKRLMETASLFGFKEIRVPTFEHTELFNRGVGDTTDVVQKEMYTFLDKGERSITLRPEFTAGVVRSSIEHSLVNGTLPVKACYIGGCYRYEKPQAGRLREFHQFGIECLGTSAAAADAEAISLADHILKSIGIKNISLEINSIGCPNCRKEYHKALKEYFEGRKEELCGTCLDRLSRNPMRILDCKSPICKEIAAGAPVVLDFLCDDCKEHFETVKSHLTAAGLEFTVNPHIVRGLDYYTKTVFEFVSNSIGAQSTVCGGGRYDGLIAELGGPAVQSVGFAMGLERLMMVAEAEGAEFPEKSTCDIYFAPMGEKACLAVTKLCTALRAEGFEALTDVNGRGLKAQMKYADKIGAKLNCVIGDNELESGKLVIKNMKTGDTYDITLNDFVEQFYDIVNKIAFDDLSDSVL